MLDFFVYRERLQKAHRPPRVSLETANVCHVVRQAIVRSLALTKPTVPTEITATRMLQLTMTFWADADHV